MSLLQDIQNKDLVDQRLNELGFYYNHVSKCLYNTLKLRDNRYHYILSGFTTTIYYKDNILIVCYPDCWFSDRFPVDDIADLDLAINKVFDRINELAIKLSKANGSNYYDVIWGCVKVQ